MNVCPEKQEMLSEEMRKRANVFFAQYPDLMQHSGSTLGSGYPVHKVILASYEPEIARYGNLQSMPWAEAQFCSSSVFILDWINSRKKDSSVLVQALSMHLMLLYATKWEFPALLRVCDLFIDGWLLRLYDPTKDPAAEKEFWLKQFESSFAEAKSQILPASQSFWASLTEGDTSNKTAHFVQKNTSVMRSYSNAGFEETKLHEIVTSMMHMNNNRLGISNYEEAYAGYCLYQALDFISRS